MGFDPPGTTRATVNRGRIISRRELLQVGSLGLMGLSLPRLLAAETKSAALGRPARAESCILIFLNGGASHLDMWDMKPQASDGIRGEFHPIASSIPGYQVCEHLPRLARQMHRTSVIRSMHHSVNNAHAQAVYASLTGHDRGDAQVAIGTGPDDYPTIGSVLSLFRPPRRTVVPQVHLPYITKEGAGGPPQPGFFGGLLGHGLDPLFVLSDPNKPDFSVPELTLTPGVTQDRLSSRRKLFQTLGELRPERPHLAVVDAMDTFQTRALDLLTSEATQRAFGISDEPDSIRQSYGRNIYGQSVLLARRLIEAGSRAVTISWAPHANATWDTHTANFKTLKATLLPQFDAACAGLIADLADRGLLERTLVAVLGDFGRTPKINGNDGGRDHWNYCYSVMLAGGGFQPGLIYGESDSTGAFPAAAPLEPGDLIATMYEAFGIRHDTPLYDPLQRPHRLVPQGDMIGDLLT